MGGEGDPGFIVETPSPTFASMFCCTKSEYDELEEEESRKEAEEKKPMKLGDVTRTMKMIVPFFWPKNETALKLRMVVSLLLIFVSKLINLGVPYVMGVILERLSVNSLVMPTTLILLYGALRTANSMVTEVQSTVFLNVTQYASRLLSVDAFRHLHALSLNWHLKRKTGAVLRTINRGTGSISTLIRIVLFTLAPTLLELVMVCVLMTATYGYPFALITFGSIGSYCVVTFVLTNWRKRFRRVSNRLDSVSADIAVDSLLNFETVKSFTAQEFEVERYDVAMRNYFKVEIASRVSLLVLNSSQVFCVTVGLVGSLLLAAYEIQQKTLNIGELIAVQLYIAQVAAPLSWLGSAWEMIQSAAVDAESLVEILEEEEDVRDVLGAKDLQPGDGSIEFENVSFAYGTDKDAKPILKNVSFRVEGGQTVGIVGATGSGKSTIARLLVRYYDTTSGSIKVSGQEVRSLTQKSLRRAIGVVSQDTVLFNSTVGFNIAFGAISDGPVTQRQIEDAAREAQILDFIMNSPKKFETLVGERGLRLSGGEKQRIAIARVILKNPSFLILDESTSALDTRTERLITESLQQIQKNRTSLVIAHRLSTVMGADKIVVLDQGQVVETGTHEELLQKEGHYAKLWKAQLTASTPHDLKEKGKEEASNLLLQ